MMLRHSDTIPTLRRQLKFINCNGLCKMSACRRKNQKKLPEWRKIFSGPFLNEKYGFWRTYIFRADSADTPTNEVKSLYFNGLRCRSSSDKIEHCADMRRQIKEGGLYGCLIWNC